MSEWDSPPFGGVGGGFLGRFDLLHRYALHVTFFAYGVFVGRQGGYSFIIIYNIYIIYNNNFIYILIYNLFTLKIYILLLFVLLGFFALKFHNFYPLY